MKFHDRFSEEWIMPLILMLCSSAYFTFRYGAQSRINKSRNVEMASSGQVHDGWFLHAWPVPLSLSGEQNLEGPPASERPITVNHRRLRRCQSTANHHETPISEAQEDHGRIVGVPALLGGHACSVVPGLLAFVIHPTNARHGHVRRRRFADLLATLHVILLIPPGRLITPLDGWVSNPSTYYSGLRAQLDRESSQRHGQHPNLRF